MVYRGFKYNNREQKVIPAISFEQSRKSLKSFFEYNQLEKITSIDTSNIIDMTSMFEGCHLLVEAPWFDMSNVIKARRMFADCFRLESIPKYDLSKVEDASSMFGGCSGLTINFNLDLPNCINTNSMFFRSGIESFESDTSNIISMVGMFQDTTNLKKISLDMSNCRDARALFRRSKVKEIELFNCRPDLDLGDSSWLYTSAFLFLSGLQKLLIHGYSSELTLETVRNTEPYVFNECLESLGKAWKKNTRITLPKYIKGKVNESIATSKGYEVFYG